MQFTCGQCPYLNLFKISLSLSEAKSTHNYGDIAVASCNICLSVIPRGVCLWEGCLQGVCLQGCGRHPPAGADAGFPLGGGANPRGGGANIRLCQIFPKTA